ncbi:trehalose-phosphatase [Microbacterium saperdae]|uniref:Trehalose 6-phosphate phosphatase n=1 Tax=Microbacterium saperdae TaxID=69368 RepID=A0A543BNK8_9MICO|nr:trehalose-phosphatase [Microbacterium saperdae]TQL86378.1 trehalose 6-phosphatase [Microbacterium saperdae]GGM48430.1 trehalose 6-phosphate phosphatase [Microbacterium saperdae]
MTRVWTPGAPDADVSAVAATERLVVALDFDGTASPLVPDPMAARALPEVAAQVARLAALPNTVVAYVSGRSLHDLREITEHEDDSLIVLAGSHGAQYWFPGDGEADAAGDPTDDGAREELWAAARPIIERYEGAEFEPKTFGMGVHTRRADREVEKQVFAEIDALVAERFPHWRRRAGHRVLEFSSRTEGKDAAMATLRERLGATGIVFAGDDVTDEDAMRVLGDGDLGVRVGPGESAAAIRVENPQQMALLLEALADERAALQE